MLGTCRGERPRGELPIAHPSLSRRRCRSRYGLGPVLSRTLSSPMRPIDSSCLRRQARSNRIPHVGRQSPRAGYHVSMEQTVLIVVPAHAGNSSVCWSEARLRCQDRRCLLVRADVFSRLSSSSHGHGGKLCFKIIHRLRNRSVLGKFSSLSEHLSGE